jgi:DNA-binding CsgD family transcriptional regulator
MTAYNLEGADLLDLARDYVDKGPTIDPALVPFPSYVAPLVTLIRRELVDDKIWFGAALVSEKRRKARIGDAIYSKRRTCSSNTVDALCINRAWGDAPFEVEERNLVQLFQEEAAWLFSRPSGSHRGRALSARQRDVLKFLLAGAAEKEIAGELGISRHTVHGHVKDIYSYFGARSRPQLMARIMSVCPAGDDRPVANRDAHERVFSR